MSSNTDSKLDEALKPCPFCGDKAVQLEDGRVFCGLAACSAFYQKFAAVEQWNRRASTPPNESLTIPDRVALNPTVAARYSVPASEGDVEYVRVGAGDAPNLQRRLYDECLTANWDPEKRNTFAEEIAHLHEELSEAFRAWRRYKDCEIREVNGKLEGVPIEFADALIGMFYNAELHGFDLLEAIEIKHRFNLTRNYVQEGRQLHAAVGGEAQLHYPFAARHANCVECDKEHNADPPPTFRTTKEAMEYAARNKMPIVTPGVATGDNEGEKCQRRPWPCRYRNARQCAHDNALGAGDPKVCDCSCHAAALRSGKGEGQ